MKPDGRTAALLSKTRLGRKAVEDSHYRMVLAAGLSLGCNLLYALYHGLIGWFQSSLWFLSMFAFYGVLSLLRFSAVLCAHKAINLSTEIFVMRGSGILLVLLSVILSGMNYLSLSQNIATRYEKIIMITIAAYTFYKITMAIIKRVKQRADPSLLTAVLRNICYAEVAASLLTLQRSMLVSFGEMAPEKIDFMNSITGAGACLFICVLGILLAVRAGKEKQKWQNQNL